MHLTEKQIESIDKFCIAMSTILIIAATVFFFVALATGTFVIEIEILMVAALIWQRTEVQHRRILNKLEEKKQ